MQYDLIQRSYLALQTTEQAHILQQSPSWTSTIYWHTAGNQAGQKSIRNKCSIITHNKNQNHVGKRLALVILLPFCCKFTYSCTYWKIMRIEYCLTKLLWKYNAISFCLRVLLNVFSIFHRNSYMPALMLIPAGSFRLAITTAYAENLSTGAVPVVSMYSMSDALAVLMLKQQPLETRFHVHQDCIQTTGHVRCDCVH